MEALTDCLFYAIIWEGGFTIILSQRIIGIGKQWIDKYLSLSHNALIIVHHGRKGQKWGRRNGPPYPLDKSKTESYNIEMYDILDPETGDVFHLVKGSKIQDKKVFAGKGTKISLHEGVAEGLSQQIGGNPSEWRHCKGLGKIDYHGEERKAEIHWFEESSVGKHKFKIKKWIDD